MAKICILGAGTWGISLARVLSNVGHNLCVWSAIDEEIDNLNTLRMHPNLPGMQIPADIEFTKNIRVACADKEFIIVAVPSIYFRNTVKKLVGITSENQIFVSVTKGIEQDTLFTMTEIIEDELGENIKTVALSGPTHAEEVAKDLPSAIVSSSKNLDDAKKVQNLFDNTCLRVYTNDDTKGVELCGALKNIIALASGISDGLGYGDNAKAALITRGMAEITRLGIALGCLEQTFFGLAGIGDLIVTATSLHSRNYKCGYLIGQGLKAQEAIKNVGMVVEGINVLPAAIRLQKKYNIEMPLVCAVNDIINLNSPPQEIVIKLMGRSKKNENLKTVSDTNFEIAILKKNRGVSMKRVITYGTFDLLHYGHINLLRRAKALGDYLIVALSTDKFNWEEKKKKCYFSYEQRKALLESVRYVDLVIPEESWEQKRNDMHEYHIDTFVMGDDWRGKFDFLKEEGVEVIYLSRTPEISTTQIKENLGKKGEK